MNTPLESDLDLEKLFLPAWAQGEPAGNKYANFRGEERREQRPDDRPGGRRPPRRDSGPGGPPRGARPGGPRGSRPREDGDRRDQREPIREAPLPMPQVAITILPEEKGVASLARQIRMAGRAYALFDIARLILQKPERQQILFEVIKKDGKAVEPLFLCALDDTLWLSEAEAVSYFLKRHFDTCYQMERNATAPPKGVYTFVAQCGMSGAVLGPPNHHDYQNQLRKLHAERYSRMPFEAYKARVKIVRDEAVVKKWIEEQSFKTEYNCLNVPEPKKLGSREEVEKHFREVHAPNLIKQVESHRLSGVAAGQLRSPGLQRLLRQVWDDQRRFPLQVATILSQQFAGHGLQFFKVNRTVTHVSVARPHYLDLEATPVSEGVRKIVDFINATSKCTRRKLFEALVPSPAAPAAPVGGAAAAAPVESPEQTALAGDLHWLVHQGHVMEFASGTLETAKKPLDRPPRQKPAADGPPVLDAAEASAPPQPAEATETDAAKLVPAQTVAIAEASPAVAESQ